MENSGQSNGASQGMGGVKKVIIVVIAVLAVIILLQNTQVVTLHFLFWRLSMSQALLFPLTLLIGFVLGLLIVSLSGKKSGGRSK